MKQKKIDSAQVLEFPLTGVAKLFNPVIFKEGDSYCCLFGEDPQAGVFGCGETVEEALANWDLNLKEHLNNAGDNDPVKLYAREILNTIPKVTPPHIQAFYDQFYPVRHKRVTKNKSK